MRLPPPSPSKNPRALDRASWPAPLSIPHTGVSRKLVLRLRASLVTVHSGEYAQFLLPHLHSLMSRYAMRSARDTLVAVGVVALEELFERHSLTHQLTDAASVTGAVSATLNVEYIGVREWSWRINGSGLTPGLSAIAMRISARSDSSRRSVAA